MFGLMGKHRVFRLLAARGGPGDLVFEREVLASEDGGYLGGLHPVVIRHGLRKFPQETFLFNA